LEVDWAVLKAESEARKAAADARKAEADASAAATKAQLGDLANVSTTGTTTAGDKAGTIEAAILSNATTRTISARIISDLCARAPELCASRSSGSLAPMPQASAQSTICDAMSGSQGAGPVKLYVVTEAEKPTFDTAENVQAALCGIQRKLSQAILDSERLTSGGAAQALAPAAALTLLNTAANLFRSDYAVQGVAVSPDDALLAKSVAAAAIGRVTAPVILPAIYRPAALAPDNPLLILITGIESNRTRANELARQHTATGTNLKRRGKRDAKQVEAHAAVAGQLNAAVKSYDDYVTKISTPSDKGLSELAEAARQMQMRADLAAGSYLLSLKMNAAGGSSYTKKNFWTFLGGVPFHVSGGTTASYALINGREGTVAGAGTYGAAGGFKSIGRIHKRRGVQ
jgi:hypothetical protein